MSSLTKIRRKLKKLGMRIGEIDLAWQEVVREFEVFVGAGVVSLPCLPRARSRVREFKRREFEDKIKPLYEDGILIKDIAARLGFSIGTIRIYLHRMVERGIIVKRDDPRTSVTSLDSQRVKTIVSMVKKRATLQEIGDVLGLTRERARQLIVKIKKIHGQVVFGTDEKLYSVTEAANALGLTKTRLEEICACANVPARYRSVASQHDRLFNEVDLEAIRRYIDNTYSRTCVVCNKAFNAVYREHKKSVTCSRECTKKFATTRAYYYYGRSFDIKNARQEWRRELYKKLQEHTIPANDQWLTRARAVKQSGLTMMQLEYLRLRSLIECRQHPTKRFRGKPVCTFSASQMALIYNEVSRHNQSVG